MTRSGGRVGLATWLPGGFLRALGQVLAPFLPPPPAGAQPPSLRGDASYLHALLTANSLEVRHDETADLGIILPDADSAVSLLIETAGHLIAERDHLAQQGRWQQRPAPVDYDASQSLIALRAGVPGQGHS